jgi:hypothetical protein
MPLYKYTNFVYRYPFEYAISTKLETAVTSLFVIVFVNLISQFKVSNEIFKFGNYRNRIISPYMQGMIITLVGVSSMLYVEIQIRAIGYENYLNDRILIASEIGIFTRLDTLVIMGIALQLAGMLAQNQRLKLLKWVLLAGTSYYAVHYYSLMQSRNSIFLLFIVVINIYFYYKNYKLSLSFASVRNIAVLILATGTLIYTGYKTTVARYSHSESVYAAIALDNIVFTALDGPFGNDENLLWLNENNHNYLLGATYLAGITNLVPRAFWSDKPLGAGPEIRNLIYPGSYKWGEKGNSSITTGYLTEAKMNFGFIGFIIVGIVWVLVSKNLVKQLEKSMTPDLDALIIFMISFISTAFVYSEFLGFFTRLMICVVPVVALRKLNSIKI